VADTFVKMVEFRASGLDEIKAKLDTVNAVQNKLTSSVKDYRKASGDAVRTLRQQERLISSGVFQRRLRQTQELMKAQERLNRMIEKEKMIARYGSVGGRLAYHGGGAARGAANVGMGVAAAGFVGGMAGLQNTVAMAQFQNELQRVNRELGNTMAPAVRKVSNLMQRFANWMEKRPEWQQNVIGTGLAAGAGLGAVKSVVGWEGIAAGGAAAMSGLGAAKRGIGRGVVNGLWPAANKIGDLAPNPLKLARYAGRAAWPIAAVAAAGSAVRGKYNVDESMGMQDRLSKGDLSGTEDFGQEYNRRFGGLQGEERLKAIRKEQDLLNKIEAAGIEKMKGPNSDSFLGRMYDQVMYKNSGTGMVNEANQRQAVLRAMAEGKDVALPKTDHRMEPQIGGQFQGLGAGYDAAYTALAKAGVEHAEENAKNLAEMNEKMSQLVESANEIRKKNGMEPLQR